MKAFRQELSPQATPRKCQFKGCVSTAKYAIFLPAITGTSMDKSSRRFACEVHGSAKKESSDAV